LEPLELKNIDRIDGDAPTDFGWTLLIRPGDGESPDELLNRLKDVWASVARWGTWRDEELGEWPSDEDCLTCLPDWFRKEIEHHSTDAWLSDLHDRDWIWWSSSVLDGLVKVDLNSESLPISVWMIEVVAKSAGGKVIYHDHWIPAKRALEIAKS
jgi:hypothetical protein